MAILLGFNLWHGAAFSKKSPAPSPSPKSRSDLALARALDPDLILSSEQIVLGRKLAVGGTAQVYSCTLRRRKHARDGGGSTLGPSQVLAAAKVMPVEWYDRRDDTSAKKRASSTTSSTTGNSSREALLQECTIWARVSAQRHPHIATLYGVAGTPSSLLLAVELFHGGSLDDELRRLRSERAPPPSPAVLREQLRQVASAMAFLHGMDPPVLHRDIKSANVLLTHRMTGCAGATAAGGGGGGGGGGASSPSPPSCPRLALTDFGVSRTLCAPGGGAMTAETGSYRWMAPEVVCHAAYDSSCDVYSYGMLAWEMLTYQTPFGDAATDVQAAYKAAVQKQRPPIPEDGRCDAATRELITSCWAQEASARPSAVELLETLAGHG